MTAIGAVVRVHTVGLQPKLAGNIQRTIEVILLRDDQHLFRSEDRLGAVHGLVGGKAGMVHKHICHRHAVFHGITLHGIHFIVIFPSMVAAHKQLRRSAGMIQRNTPLHPILQHMAESAVILHLAAKHNDAIHILQLSGLLRGENGGIRAAYHPGIHAKHSGSTQHRQAHARKQSDPQPFGQCKFQFHTNRLLFI